MHIYIYICMCLYVYAFVFGVCVCVRVSGCMGVFECRFCCYVLLLLAMCIDMH